MRAYPIVGQIHHPRWKRIVGPYLIVRPFYPQKWTNSDDIFLLEHSNLKDDPQKLTPEAIYTVQLEHSTLESGQNVRYEQ